jgi:hypothetical protein
MNAAELCHVHVIGANADSVIRRKYCRLFWNNLDTNIIRSDVRTLSLNHVTYLPYASHGKLFEETSDIHRQSRVSSRRPQHFMELSLYAAEYFRIGLEHINEIHICIFDRADHAASDASPPCIIRTTVRLTEKADAGCAVDDVLQMWLSALPGVEK